MNWAEGKLVTGRYRLEAPLGSGGMGAVWRAQHVALATPVAIKVIHGGLLENSDVLARFLREARAAASLRGTHVVQIFDFGVEDGVPFIVMELLNGESLQTRLERGPLSLSETLEVLAQVARALDGAHRAGIVHRDLKPDNLFLCDDNGHLVVKVLDFGIAKTSGDPAVRTALGLTRTGVMLGTPYYMSPEQAQGTRLIDGRSDLWALGVIAFNCVTGRRPFDSEALGDLVLKICTRDAPAPSSLAEVPPAFDAWFARAVAKQPEARFQTAKELVQGLRDVADAAHVDTDEAPSLEDAELERLSLGPAQAPPASLTQRSELAPLDAGYASTTGAIASSAIPLVTRRMTRGRGATITLSGVIGVGALGVAAWSVLRADYADPQPEHAAVAATADVPTTPAPVTPSQEAGAAAKPAPPEATAAPDVATPAEATPTKKLPARSVSPRLPKPKKPAPSTSKPTAAAAAASTAQPQPQPAPAPTPPKSTAGLFDDRKF